MHPRFERRLRPIAIIILFFFSWICIEPWNYAIAMQSSVSKDAGSAGSQRRERPVSERFQEDLREIKRNINAIVEEEDFQKRLAERLAAFQSAVQEERKSLNATREDVKRFLQIVKKKTNTTQVFKTLQRRQKRLSQIFNQVHLEGNAIEGLLRGMVLPTRLKQNHEQSKEQLIVQNKTVQKQFRQFLAQAKKKKGFEKSKDAFFEASVALENGLERFQDVLESMVDEATPEKRRVQILAKVLEKEETLDKADQHIRKTFDQTKKDLINRGLPQVILDRQSEALQAYEKNFEYLRSELDSLRQVNEAYVAAIEERDLSAVQSVARELISKATEFEQFLEENVKEAPNTPLDPDKLPHRAPKVKKRKPRLKKEEFTEFQKPVQLAFNGDVSNLLLAQATPDLPTPEDLAETIEGQFTQAIIDLAASLENKPVKIYNWVRNNIDFVPTWGSIQGADHCFSTKQCNAMDTASLLIALLRTSGISARYVMGTIKVPIDQIMNWAGGFSDEASALNFLSSGGIPITGLISGGNISAGQLEHVWVEAYIDYIPSRGAVHKQGDTWIPLDASFKQYTFTEGLDLQAAVPIDIDAFVTQIESTATINETEGYVANVDTAFIQTTFTDLQVQIDSYLEANLPDATVGDLIGEKTIGAKAFPFFSATLPYQKVVSGNPVSALSDSLRHMMTFKLTTEAFFGSNMSFSASLPELAGKRITLSYVPASPSDQQTVDSYGGLYETPSYLIAVKPQLKVEGSIKAEGAAVGMGNNQNFTMIFSLPNVGFDQIQNNITAGGYYAVGLVIDRLPDSYSTVLQQRAQRLSDFAEAGGDRTSDQGLGEQLYLSVMTYFWEVDRQTDTLASQAGMIYAKQPGEGIFALSLAKTLLFGVPMSLEVIGTEIDVDRATYIPFSKSGDLQAPINFLRATGTFSSSSEDTIMEEFYGVEGISAAKAIYIANVQGSKIYTITSSNISTILPLLQVSNAVKADVINAVNTGKEVTIPERDVQLNDWSGIGYIVSDPLTGAGAYLISGGLAGGAGSVSQDFENIQSFQEKYSGIISCLIRSRTTISQIFKYVVLLVPFFGVQVFGVYFYAILAASIILVALLLIFACIFPLFVRSLRHKNVRYARRLERKIFLNEDVMISMKMHSNYRVILA